MTIYVYDKAAGMVVEKNKAPQSSGPFFMRDIEPYRSPVTGAEITSRSHRREDLKRHGCVDTRELRGTRLANGKIHKG